MGVLREAIDEIREEFVWAVRNDRLGGTAAADPPPLTDPVPVQPDEPITPEAGTDPAPAGAPEDIPAPSPVRQSPQQGPNCG